MGKQFLSNFLYVVFVLFFAVVGVVCACFTAAAYSVLSIGGVFYLFGSIVSCDFLFCVLLTGFCCVFTPC